MIAATTGEKAVELAAGDTQPDLILMDIMLGRGINGAEAAEQILAKRNIPIVFLSSHSDREVLDKIRGISRYGYVLKNSDEFVLQSLIHMSIELFEGSRRLGNEFSKRILAEEALHKNEEWNKIVLSTILSGLIVIDADTRKIVQINETALSLIGLPTEQVVGQVCHNFICPANKRNCPILDNGQTVDFSERKLLTGDGRHKDIIKTVNRVFLHGRDYLIESFVDITERKRSEEALQNERLLLRTLIDNIPDSIYTKDLASRKTLANPADLHHMGASSESEVLGKNDFDLYPKELAERFFADDQSVIQTGTPVINREEYIYDEKGRKRWLLSSKIPLRDRDNKIIGIVGIGHDITERRRMEEALRESEERNRLIIDNIGEGVGFVDADERFAFSNRAAEEIFGDKLIGKNIHNFVSGEQFELIQKETVSRAQGNKNSYELEIMRPNGEQRYIIVTAVPLIDKVRGFLGTYGVFRDITERKQAEVLIRDMQRREAVGVLSGGIAHDYNNLLGIMMGNISLVQTQLPADHPAIYNIEKALSAMERAAKLTQQMLAYSGKGKFQIETIDVAALIYEHVSLFHLSLQKNVKLLTHLPSSPVYVGGDPAQVEQIIMNLIINGGEAIGDKQGVVSVALGEVNMGIDELVPYGKLTNTDLSEGSYALLEVSDTGTGMNQETINKIFDPFFSTKFTGRGLGLSAVFGIIQGHKGGIAIESREGVGTILRVILPAAAAPVLAEERVTSENQIKAADTTTILVIDDEPDVAEMARDILETGDYSVETELNPIKGIELYRQHRSEIGVVLLDLTMPEMSGREVVDALQLIDPDVKIIITSGYSKEDVTLKLGAVKVSGFIQKPYRLQSLLSIVANILH